MGLVILGSAFAQDAVEKDRKRILGTWVVISSELDGAMTSDEKLKEVGLKFVFNEKTSTTITKDGASAEHGYSLAPGTNPKGIFMVPFTKTDIQLDGIYSFEGELLKICFSEDGIQPKVFPADSSGYRMMVLRKESKNKEKR